MKTTLLSIALAALALAPPAIAATGGPDAYGYTWDDATPYHWIDISTTGEVVINFGVNVSSITPVVGIGAPVDLGFPFTMYGTTYTRLVPCSNGYLSSLTTEQGLDNNNDCPLPKIPSHGGGARIYAFHDDLSLSGAGASLYYQYFHTSPHPYATCGVSVFTWKNVARNAAPANLFDFQVLLFDTGDILINYDTKGLVLGSPHTIGIQNAAATTALSWSCNAPAALSGKRAIVFIPPTLVVGTLNDENDLPAGAAISLREAIRDIPTGGKIKFSGNGRNLDYPATLTINRAMSLVGDFEGGGWRSVRTARISLVVNNAPVCITNLDVHDGPGNTFVANNSAVLKLAGCSVQGSVQRAIYVANNARASLVRTNIEFPAPGSLDLVTVEEGTLHLHESALADSYRSGINVKNTTTPLPASPQVSLFHSSVIRCREHGVVVSGARAEILASTISDNQGDGLLVVRDSVLDLKQSAALDNSRGLVLENNATATITRTVLGRNSNRATQAASDLVVSASTATSGGHNLAGAAYGVFTATGDVVAADPKFTPVGPYGPAIGCLRFPGQLYAHHPLASSPAIDGGGLAAAPANLPTDLRGLARVANGDNAGGAIIDIGPLEAGPFLTVTTAVDENNGIGAGAGASLRECAALASASPGTRILFAGALNKLTINLDIANGGLGTTIGIDKFCFVDASQLTSLTLSYNQQPGGPLIGGGGWHGITLAGARAQAVNNFVTLTLSSCVFFDNQAPDNASFGVRVNGGAIFNADYLHLTDCRFVSNQTSNIVGGRGGAVATQSSVPMGGFQTRGASHFIRCHFENNTGHGGGGAIYQHPASRRALIDRCTFKKNFTDLAGGGIEMFETQIVGVGGSSDSKRVRNLIFRSAFHENQSLDTNFIRGGGAIAAYGGVGAVLPIHFCTFHDNYSQGEGGAIYVSSASIVVDVGGSPVLFPGCTLDVFRSTITNNNSDGGAGGGGIAILDGTVRMTASILDFNTYFSNLTNAITPGSFLAQGTGVFQSLGRNLSGDSPLPAFNHATDIVGVDPRLGPLTHHGGPTPARHPLAGSPAINAVTAITPGTDQRGYAGRVGAAADIGAVEAFIPLVVDINEDEFQTPSGPKLSLREAIRDCLPGGWITFNIASAVMPNHFINLAAGQNTQLQIDKTLMIDATNTPKGITVSGPTNARCLNLSNGSHGVSLHGVSFRQGNASANGGGILKGSGVSLALTRSTVYQNYTSQGGGGIALLSGPAYLENVTLSANAAGGVGGGLLILAGAEARLHHCTLAYNQSVAGGAGIDVAANASLHLQYAGVVENTRTSPVILANIVAAPTATTTSARVNFSDDGPYPWLPNAGPGFADIGGLSDMGGTALGHPLLEASPMLDASLIWTTTRTDARSYSRVFAGYMDIGAIEMGSSSKSLAPLDSDGDGMPDEWEILHGLNPNSPLDADLDSDGDGQTNLQEYLAQTDPRDRLSVLRILDVDRNTTAGHIDIEWSSVPHLTYTVWRSIDLEEWHPVQTVIPESGAFLQNTWITDAPVVAEPAQFFQVRLGTASP